MLLKFGEIASQQDASSINAIFTLKFEIKGQVGIKGQGGKFIQKQFVFGTKKKEGKRGQNKWTGWKKVGNKINGVGVLE